MSSRVLAVLLFVAVTFPASAAARPGDDCRTRGTTLEANAHARLFVTFNRRSRARVYRVCRMASRKAVYIGRNDPFEEGVANTIDLSGFHVLYERVDCDREVGCRTKEVLLQDIRTPLRTQTVEVWQEGKAEATDLLLSRDLTAVWIRPGGEVVRDRPGEEPVVLASGPGLEAGSLAAAGNRIYWTNDGRPESALTR